MTAGVAAQKPDKRRPTLCHPASYCIQSGIREHWLGGTMSRVIAWGIACLASAVLTTAAHSQQPAPVPRQVLAAKAVLIANGASESYGADSYFRLTKYDGGPNRAYDSFYNAVESWGHYDLVGETADADLVLVVKFTNPIVERLHDATADESDRSIYDPQLNLSLNDPRTGLPLWAITEHIEPGGDRPQANQRFDAAVARLVDDLRRLTLRPDLGATTDNPPPGAIDAARRERRERQAGAGLMIGLATGAVVALAQGSHDPCPDLVQSGGCIRSAQHQATRQLVTGLGIMLVGGLVGWFWPVNQ